MISKGEIAGYVSAAVAVVVSVWNRFGIHEIHVDLQATKGGLKNLNMQWDGLKAERDKGLHAEGELARTDFLHARDREEKEQDRGK